MTDRGQRLTTKTERVDCFEIVELFEFRGGESLANNLQVFFVYTTAVVLDLNELEAAFSDLNVYGCRTSV